jgi:hypothetical protein
VSPVRYELKSYNPEDGILHSHRREDLKSYIFKACLISGSRALLRHVHCAALNDTTRKNEIVCG